MFRLHDRRRGVIRINENKALSWKGKRERMREKTKRIGSGYITLSAAPVEMGKMIGRKEMVKIRCEPDQGHGRVEIFHVIRLLLLILHRTVYNIWTQYLYNIIPIYTHA